jgi:replication factor A2
LDTIDTHLKFVKHDGSSAMDIDSGNGVKKLNSGNSIADRVNEVIQSFEDVPEGCSVDQIVFKLKGLHTEEEIRETVSWLQNEGQCYATIDDDHVKSCLP